MTVRLATEPQAGQVAGAPAKGGEASTSPPRPAPDLAARAVRAHVLARQGETELAWWGKRGSGFSLLGRACFIGMVHLTSPAEVEASLQALIAEVRGLASGDAA